MVKNEIFHSIDKLTEALLAAPGAFAARVRIRQSNYALFRAAYYPTSRLFLLRHKPSSGRYETGVEIPEHWHVEFLENSGELKISFAILDSDFPAVITKASYVAFGEPDADSELEVFGIDPDGVDIAAPNGANPCWTLRCRKIKTERIALAGSA